MAADPKMPILLVDDYGTMLRIIRNLLSQLGFVNIDDASNGSDALVKLQQKQYRLVISDWNMEQMTGYDLLQAVRADPVLAQIPFIMVTAESKTENVIAAQEGWRQQLHRQAVQRADPAAARSPRSSLTRRPPRCRRSFLAKAP